MKANHILVDFENVPHLPPDRIGRPFGVFAMLRTSFLALSNGRHVHNKRNRSIVKGLLPK